MRKEDSLFPMPSFRDRRKENYRGSARIAADQKLIDDFCSIREIPRQGSLLASGCLPKKQLFVADYFFLGAADGPSGWHVPVMPFMPKKQRHGLLQTSPLVHGLPHATTACVPVLS
jgi:hypothetical protein